MPEIQQLSDAMLDAAGKVLGRLVEQPVAASGTTRNDHAGSIKTDPETLVTLAEIPGLGCKVVVRFSNADVSRVVQMMLGGADDAAEMGAMQLSIVSETVSQIAAAMAEELAKGLGAGADGVRADLCSDATQLPAPPFTSYEGTVQIGEALSALVTMDFDGIALSKIAASAGDASAAPAEQPAAAQPLVQAAAPQPPRAAPKRPQPPVPPAQPVTFAAMAPTPSRAHGGSNLDLVHDVPLQISAVLGKTALALRDVVTLQSGSVFELDKLSTDPIDLYVNNILIARGEVVVVDDKFAVKISELNPVVD